jgi:hypothetical protein
MPANKVKRKAPRSAWKKGQSGNPNGRPCDGESWASTLRWAFGLTGEQAAAVAPKEMVREFSKLGKMELRKAICLRLANALLFEPNGKLFEAIASREEGKPPQTIEVNWRDEARRFGYDPDKLVNELFAGLGKTISIGGGVGTPEEIKK